VAGQDCGELGLPESLRRRLEEVVDHPGSTSGEHGDPRRRDHQHLACAHGGNDPGSLATEQRRDLAHHLTLSDLGHLEAGGGGANMNCKPAGDDDSERADVLAFEEQLVAGFERTDREVAADPG